MHRIFVKKNKKKFKEKNNRLLIHFIMINKIKIKKLYHNITLSIKKLFYLCRFKNKEKLKKIKLLLN